MERTAGQGRIGGDVRHEVMSARVPFPATLARPPRPERRTERLVQAVWLLLVLNTWAWAKYPSPLQVPQRIWQLLTLGALFAALALALVANPRVRLRPGLYMTLYTALLVVTLIPVLRMTTPLGSYMRVFRFTLFLSVLWLLSPFFGRRDLLMLRVHYRSILVACATIVFGALAFPGAARGNDEGRLQGVFPVLPPPQVGAFAVLGMTLSTLAFLTGTLSRRRLMVHLAVGVAMVLLSHTRTPVLGMVVGGTLAVIALVARSGRARMLLSRVLLFLPLIAVAAAVVVPAWFTRGQDSEQLTQLTGRTKVWSALIADPRPDIEVWLGQGLGDKSFLGLPIDSAWFAMYSEQGLIGVALGVAIMVALVATAAVRPPGLARSAAIFLIVYCLIAFVAEVGLGDASPYILHLTVAASLLMSPPSDDRTEPPVHL
jgi:hypothetical protein